MGIIGGDREKKSPETLIKQEEIEPLEHLIPHEFFTARETWALLLIGMAALYVLRYGAEWLVEGASGIAYKMGMPEVIVGATVVSLGTTAPECAVSVLAAWNGNPQLALGNAVGSVIADTALIFGMCCLLVTLPADKFVLSRQGWIQFGAGFLLAAVCYGAWIFQGNEATITRTMGGVFLLLLVGYMFLSVKWAKAHPSDESFRVSGHIAKEATPDKSVHVVDETLQHGSMLKLSILVLVGLVFVILSGHFLVESASVGAARIGIPKVVIAATLVALGTSLPELVVGITAIKKGHPGLLVGNVLGADILNVLFVVGAAAFAAPLPIIDTAVGSKLPEIFLYVHIPAMLIILTYFRICTMKAVKKGEFARWMGTPLIIGYVIYTIIPFVISWS